MLVLVTYDVSLAQPGGARRLRRVARACQDYGQRVQFSVFEIWVTDAMQRELEQALKKLIDEEDDSVRFYRLCAACQGRVKILGRGTPPQTPGVLIV